MVHKKVVVIGGGTGTFTILSGLKKYPKLDLSVIVSMMDSEEVTAFFVMSSVYFRRAI